MDLSSISTRDLVRLCTETGPTQGWEELIRRTKPLIRRTVWRTCERFGLAPASTVDDLLQDIFLRISSNRGEALKKFENQEDVALFAYLKVVAVNAVTDFCRAREAERRRASQTTSLSSNPHVESTIGVPFDPRVEQELLMKQFDEVLAQHLKGPSAGRDRAIFWLYYKQGLTLRAIASAPGVELGIKGVETLIHRLTKLVREKVDCSKTRAKMTEGKQTTIPLSREDVY